MMGEKFWTQTTTPQEWLEKIKTDRVWLKQKEKLEMAFAENPLAARREFTESAKNCLTNADVKGYWCILHDMGEVLSAMWDDMDLTESKLRLNVIGMLTEEFVNAYECQPSEENTPVLETEEANRLWDIAKEHGWVDENRLPKLSDNQAAVLANMMAEVLKMPSPIWVKFETLWGKKNLSTKFTKARDSGYYPSLYKEIKRAFL